MLLCNEERCLFGDIKEHMVDASGSGTGTDLMTMGI